MAHALQGVLNNYYGHILGLYHDPDLAKVIGPVEANNKEKQEVKTKKEETSTKVVEKRSPRALVEPKVIEVDAKEVITKESISDKLKDVETVITVPEENIKVIDEKKSSIPKEDNIKMETKITCPVKIVPSDKVKIDVTKTLSDKKNDDTLNKFIEQINSMGVRYTNIKRVSSGLVEVNLNTNTGTNLLISVDIDSKIYNLGTIIFFIGKINPLDEYNTPSFVLNKKTMYSIINGLNIDPKYYVPEKLRILNRVLDTKTLRETNKDKKEKVFEVAAKAIEKMNTEIVDNAAGESFRFAFARYKSENDFSIVSSNRNKVSNLSEEKLYTSKQIWLTVKGDTVTLKCK